MCNKEDILKSMSIVTISCSALSGLCSIILMLLYLKLGRQGGLSFHILLYMSITDLIRSTCLILVSELINLRWLCLSTAILINSSLLIHSIWSIYIIFILYRIYINFPSESEFYLKTWTITGFFIPLLFHLLPLSTDSYGKNEGICTFKADFHGMIWRGFQEFGMFFIVLVGILAYVRVVRKMKRTKIISIREVLFEKGMIYSIIFFFTLIFVILFRFLDYFFGFCSIYPFAFLAYSLVASHGTLNFLAFMGNRSFWRELVRIKDLKMDKSESFDIVQSIISDKEMFGS